MKSNPVWSDGKRELYCGDGRIIVPALPQTFDAIVTDPPYGEQLVAGDESPVESANLFRETLNACKPRLRDGAMLAFFWSNRSLDLGLEAAKAAGFEFRRLLTMQVQQSSARPYRGWMPKTQPIVVMQLPGRAIPEWREESCRQLQEAMLQRNMSQRELAKQIGCDARLVMKWVRVDDPHWSYPSEDHRGLLNQILGVELPPAPVETETYRADYYDVRGGSRNTNHPCEKPLWVIEDLMSRLGKRILDPFCGSGTALVAAGNLNLDCVGVEIDETHCGNASRRLGQLVLF